jgi:hypothetical protein
MSDFVVKRVGDFWAVVNNSIIFAEGRTAPEVVRRAVALATEAARRDGPTRVIYHSSDRERTVVWDSQKDGRNSPTANGSRVDLP